MQAPEDVDRCLVLWSDDQKTLLNPLTSSRIQPISSNHRGLWGSESDLGVTVLGHFALFVPFFATSWQLISYCIKHLIIQDNVKAATAATQDQAAALAIRSDNNQEEEL
ncbi:hypothetical protein FH972_009632 [Carpinus fangiana]|uniref:Uncharacterized protein n=1 Tax=Carpinus fangiana TaxID=176857 RepID=A0A660KP15_9ROSI|nr:hypothetical protein FH972_009632 [Carpinus fangiana]